MNCFCDSKIFQQRVLKKTKPLSFLVAQWVKDLLLLQLWCRSQLRFVSSPWSWRFRMPQARPKQNNPRTKKPKQQTNPTQTRALFVATVNVLTQTLFFFFWPPRHMEFPGQGLDPSHRITVMALLDHTDSDLTWAVLEGKKTGCEVLL